MAQSSPTTRAGPDPMRVCPSQLTVGSARPVQCPTRRGKGFGCLVVEVLKKDQPLRRLTRVQVAISSNDKTAALVPIGPGHALEQLDLTLWAPQCIFHHVWTAICAGIPAQLGEQQRVRTVRVTTFPRLAGCPGNWLPSITQQPIVKDRPIGPVVGVVNVGDAPSPLEPPRAAGAKRRLGRPSPGAGKQYARGGTVNPRCRLQSSARVTSAAPLLESGVRPATT